MSTRATYQFISRAHATVTLYVHHDGYPEGAAFYFWLMHHSDSHDRSMAARFLRANPRAEFTRSHEAHGDTEYRYTLEEGQLTASARLRDQSWAPFCYGPYWHLINRYPQSIPNFEPLRQISEERYGDGAALAFSRIQIVTQLCAHEAYAEQYAQAHPTMVGNIGSINSDVERWRKKLAAYDALGPQPTAQEVTL